MTSYSHFGCVFTEYPFYFRCARQSLALWSLLAAFSLARTARQMTKDVFRKSFLGHFLVGWQDISRKHHFTADGHLSYWGKKTHVMYDLSPPDEWRTAVTVSSQLSDRFGLLSRCKCFSGERERRENHQVDKEHADSKQRKGLSWECNLYKWNTDSYYSSDIHFETQITFCNLRSFHWIHALERINYIIPPRLCQFHARTVHLPVHKRTLKPW